MPPYQNYYNPNPYYQQSMSPTFMSGASPVQNTVQTGLNGRVVNDQSEITVNDVAMNGKFSFFPKADMSEIICKTWMPNGTISTITFKPLQNDRESTFGANANNYSLDDIKSLVDSLNERVVAIESAMKPKRSKNDE